jgi:sterol desaturase/sphingolipid hydroxylase (fatty acid hydroxylase superfamily)
MMIRSVAPDLISVSEVAMSSRRVSSSDPPIRLFRSDALELFSHISPTAVVIVWAPLVAYLIWSAWSDIRGGAPGITLPLGLFLGWFLWTLVEYLLHRFVFHYHPRTERLKRMFFIMHGVHHAQPMCRTRLVMPPALSVPVGAAAFGVFYLFLVAWLGRPTWFHSTFAGFVGGYVIYDLMHYSLHHARIQRGFFFALRKHHLRHHGRCDFMRFGVSLTLWDHVFGTMPRGACREGIERMIAEHAGRSKPGS